MSNTAQFYTAQFLTGVAVRDVLPKTLALEIFPAANASTQSGILPWIDKDRQVNRMIDYAAAPGTDAPLFSITVNKDSTFFCRKYHVAQVITDEDRAAATMETDLALDGARYTTERLMLYRDRQLKELLVASMTGAQYTAVPVTKWNATNGKPISEIKAKIAYITATTGVVPNRLAMDVSTLLQISASDEYREQFIYTSTNGGGAEVTARNLAASVGVDRVVYAENVVENTAALNAATPTLSTVWGQYVLLYRYETPRTGFNGLGLHPLWNGSSVGGIKDGFRVNQFRRENADAEIIKARGYWDQLMAYKDGAFLWSAAVTVPA